jgi:hypothetical protein
MEPTGVGGEISGGTGDVFLRELTSFRFFGEDPAALAAAMPDEDGASRDWSVRAYAICSTLLPGLEVVTDRGTADSTETQSVTVTCPAGKRVVGTAGAANTSNGQAVLSGLMPSSATTVTAIATEDPNGNEDDWFVRATAICATPPPGLQIVRVRTVVDDGELATATARCPRGKYVLGTGANVIGDMTPMLDDLRPDPALTSVTATAFLAMLGQSGTVADFAMDVYAICANP